MVNNVLPEQARRDAITQIKLTLDQIDAGTVPWTSWQERTLDMAIRAVNSGFYHFAVIEAIDAALVPVQEQAFHLRGRVGYLSLIRTRNRVRELH